MSAYAALAQSYDRLTSDVDYDGILEFCDAIICGAGLKPRTALDIACGTGSLACRLAARGLRVIGADCSEEMLTVAADRAAEMENPPFFVRQPMQALRLPGTVDLALCTLDSINYLTDPKDCRETFRRVYRALSPGGIFIFDVDTPEKLRAMDGQIFLDEDEDVYCVWRGSFEEASNICSFGMDLFQRRGKAYFRSFEEHREYAYTMDELQQYLQQAGFSQITRYGDRVLTPPGAGEQRVYFSARKED